MSTALPHRLAHALVLAVLAGACGKEDVGTDRGTPSTVAEGGAGASSASRSRKDHSVPATATDDFVIKLERGVCYGVCPEYVVVVHSDGIVDYDGKSYVSLKGHQTKNISSDAVVALANRFEKAGFAHLEWLDPCPAMMTDDATSTLTFVHDGRKRVIANYHGNPCMPQILRELENAVDATTAIKPWITCAGTYCGG